MIGFVLARPFPFLLSAPTPSLFISLPLPVCSFSLPRSYPSLPCPVLLSLLPFSGLSTLHLLRLPSHLLPPLAFSLFNSGGEKGSYSLTPFLPPLSFPAFSSFSQPCHFLTRLLASISYHSSSIFLPSLLYALSSSFPSPHFLPGRVGRHAANCSGMAILKCSSYY